MDRRWIGLCAVAFLATTLFAVFAYTRTHDDASSAAVAAPQFVAQHAAIELKEQGKNTPMSELEAELAKTYGDQKDVFSDKPHADSPMNSNARKLQATTADHTTLTNPMVIPLGNSQLDAWKKTSILHNACMSPETASSAAASLTFFFFPSLLCRARLLRCLHFPIEPALQHSNNPFFFPTCRLVYFQDPASNFVRAGGVPLPLHASQPRRSSQHNQAH